VSKKTIEERVIEQIQLNSGVSKEDILPAKSLVDDLGMDSLDTIETIMSIEEEFDIEIPDEDAERINTVQQAIDYIKAHYKEPVG